MLQKEHVSHWHQYVENLNQTPEEFYKSIEGLISRNQIPDVKTSRKKFSQGGLFSSSRIYLEVKSKGYFYHVCAAPYGKGFFVSYWQSENQSSKKGLLSKIPIVGNLITSIVVPETFYSVDTRLMFQSMIHSCVLGALNVELESRGLRNISSQSNLDNQSMHGTASNH